MATVPAWKRLGLKLKGPSSDGSPIAGSTTPQASTNTSNSLSASAAANQYGTTAFNKRKQLPSASYPASDFKRPRRNDTNFIPLKKFVSSSQDTTKAVPKKTKKKGPKQSSVSKQAFDLTPALEYLRTWNKARGSWKFNKNHQTLLIKYLYDSDAIPPADIDAFYTYIRDIKGASRQRLVQQAQDIRNKDMEAGAKGFSEGVKAPEEKKREYEEMLAELLKQKAELNKSGGGSDGTNSGASKRSFDEMEFVLRTVDNGIKQRIVKRMRAETVIDELESSESGECTDPAAATNTAHAARSRVKVPVAGDEASGSKQKTKRKKKLRTADSDSSSGSDSGSDSDSDSSSSGSDSDDAGQDAADDGASSSSSGSDSDEEMVIPDGPDEDASSSSSSSSSSESDSDSESGGAKRRTADAVEDTSGSDGDSESSDSDGEEDDGA